MFAHLRSFFTQPAALAVGCVFLVNCLLFSSWIAHIPEVKTKLALSDGLLGLCLFAFPLGVLAVNSQTGKLAARFGAGRMAIWSGLIIAPAICLPVISTNVFTFAGSLFLLGAILAMMNVSMNATASIIEKKYELRILSTCHGMWSSGGIIGSVLAAFWMGQFWNSALHMLFVGGCAAIIILCTKPFIYGIAEEKRTNIEEAEVHFVRPDGNLLLLILVGCTISVGEGLAFDWSSVYMRDVVAAPAGAVALAYAAFSAAMTLGRFSGDSMIPRFGAHKILQIGGVLAAFGLITAVVFPYTLVALFGFFLLGLGVSIGMPILYITSLRLDGVSPAAGLATFTTYATLGFLTGPPIIGGIANVFGLPQSVLFVAFLLLVGALLVRFAIQKSVFDKTNA